MRTFNEEITKMYKDNYNCGVHTPLQYVDKIITYTLEIYGKNIKDFPKEEKRLDYLQSNQHSDDHIVIIGDCIANDIRWACVKELDKKKPLKDKILPIELQKMREEDMKKIGEPTKVEEKTVVKKTGWNASEKDTFTFCMQQETGVDEQGNPTHTEWSKSVKIPSHLSKDDKHAIINSICTTIAWELAKKTHRYKKLGRKMFKANKDIQVMLSYDDVKFLDTKELALECNETNSFGVRYSTFKDKKGILTFASRLIATCSEFANEFNIIDGQVETDDFESMF